MIVLTAAFLCSFIVTLLVVRYQDVHARFTADHDLTGIQKFHSFPVPRVGGVGVIVGILAGLSVVFYSEADVANFGFLVLISSTPAFFVGFIEDLTKSVSVMKRLLATALSAAIGGVLLGAWLTRLDIFFIDYLMAIKVISVFVSCFAVAGVANSFNLIDGYNGLAGMVSVIILSGLAFVSNQVGDHSVFIATIATIGGVLGFFVWNYPKGVIFLGDGGAYLVGFFVAELSVLLVVRNAQISPWFPMLLVLYPISETVFTIYRRIVIEKKHPGLPDAAHLHQLIYRRVVRLNVGKNCNRKNTQRNALTSIYLWGMAIISVLPAAIFWDQTLILQIIGFIYVAFYILVYRFLVRGRIPRWFQIKN